MEMREIFHRNRCALESPGDGLLPRRTSSTGLPPLLEFGEVLERSLEALDFRSQVLEIREPYNISKGEIVSNNEFTLVRL